jgi:hypothetical protein
MLSIQTLYNLIDKYLPVINTLVVSKCYFGNEERWVSFQTKKKIIIIITLLKRRFDYKLKYLFFCCYSADTRFLLSFLKKVKIEEIQLFCADGLNTQFKSKEYL